MTEPSVSLRHTGLLEVTTRVLGSGQFAGWLGQGIVSATNFIVLLLVARWAGMEQLGYYALGFSILVMAMAVQDALVTRPYAVQLFRPPGGPEAHAYGSLVFGIVLSVVLAAVVGLAGWIMTALERGSGLAGVLIALSAMIPFILVRDFARRFSFANLYMHRALAIDAGVCVTVLAALVMVALAGRLDAAAAMICLGVSGGFVGSLSLFLMRGSFRRVPGVVTATARQSWTLGKWLLSSQLMLQLQGYAAHWIILVQAGAAVTGVYSALLSVVALANPFLFGLINMLMPRYVRARHAGGDRSLRREAFRDAALIGGVMGAFALVLWVGGGEILRLLFPSGIVEEGVPVLGVLALASALAAMAAPANIGMTAAERGRTVAGLSLAGCVANSIAVILLLPAYGLIGAAWGMLAVDAFGSLARWFMFLRVANAPPADASGTKSASQA